MGTFLEHRSCDQCGSSDARAIYDNGSSYCWACEATTFGNDGVMPEPVEEDKPKKVHNFLDGTHQELKARGLSLTTVELFGYHIAKLSGQPAQVADYFDNNRNLIAQHLRFKDKGFSWIGLPAKVQLFGQNLWKSPKGKRLVITEGEIDAMTISQCFGHKWPVVSVPSGASSAKKYIQKNLEFVNRYGEVVLAFDDDEAGKKAAAECSPLLPPGVASIMKYDGYKDANELYLANRERVVKCVYESQTWRPDGIVGGAELLEEIMKIPKQGFDTIYPKLNTKTKGILPGELWLWTAGSGIGKSTAVHEIIYNLAMQHGQTVGIMSLEESVKIAAERHIGIHLGVPMQVDRKRVTDEEIAKAHAEIYSSGKYYFYRHFGSTQIDNLLAKIRYMVVGLGCTFILLDHISIVVSALDFGVGDSERLMIDRLMTKLRSLVEETGCGIQAVVHLKRKSGKGKGYNEGGKVSLTDLRGSASLEQLSDTVIAMERDQQNEACKNYSQVRLLKHRRTGDTGAADILEYSPFSGRLVPSDLKEMPKGDSDAKTNASPFNDTEGDY